MRSRGGCACVRECRYSLLREYTPCGIRFTRESSKRLVERSVTWNRSTDLDRRFKNRSHCAIFLPIGPSNHANWGYWGFLPWSKLWFVRCVCYLHLLRSERKDKRAWNTASRAIILDLFWLRLFIGKTRIPQLELHGHRILYIYRILGHGWRRHRHFHIEVFR